MASRPHGSSAEDLRSFLSVHVSGLGTSKTDFLEEDVTKVMTLTAVLASTIGGHPVVKTGSAEDIIYATYVLDVLDNLERQLQVITSKGTPATDSSSTAQREANSSSSSDASATGSSSTASQQRKQLSRDEANSLAFNALSYMMSVTGGLIKAHCKDPLDTSGLSREPIAAFRKLVLPRLRPFLLVPHPQVAQAALQAAALLCGLAQASPMECEELQQLFMFERHPTRHVVARWLDSDQMVDSQGLRALVSGLNQCVAAQHAAAKAAGLAFPPNNPIATDFDLPASSWRQVMVCDACGRHNYFPMLRWQKAWAGPCELKACSGCKSRLYCSVECQKQHWKGHKQRCKAIQAAKQAAKVD